ncbi:PIN domain-containing protein [Promineifilum sp.]|uniref:PIN domain-containing protein n=1 Tax=Promineifilum sp. TaxID=2664178 RepID=UPI0035AFC560
MNNSYVLDAFAVLAFINQEPGGPRVGALFEAAASAEIELSISLINLGEVLYRIARQHGEAEANIALSTLDASPLAYLAVTRDRVLAASRLKAIYRISYADAFAAAAAEELDAVVVTGAPEFRGLEGKLKIEWLPQPKR